MKKYRVILLAQIFIAVLLLSGCAFQSAKIQGYPEVPSMLNVLTNKAQIAVEEGQYDKGGESAVLDYVNTKNPKTLMWFSEQGLDLRVGVIAETAVVMVCDQGTPVYEDTYCRPGAPDKDHRSSSLLECEISMTEAEVLEVCE